VILKITGPVLVDVILRMLMKLKFSNAVAVRAGI